MERMRGPKQHQPPFLLFAGNKRSSSSSSSSRASSSASASSSKATSTSSPPRAAAAVFSSGERTASGFLPLRRKRARTSGVVARNTNDTNQNWNSRDNFDGGNDGSNRRSRSGGGGGGANEKGESQFIPLEEETEREFREQSLNRIKQFIDETAADPEKAMKDPKTVGQKVLNLMMEMCEIWNPPKFLYARRRRCC